MNFLIYRALDIVFRFIEIVIIIRIVISWLPFPRDNKLVIILYQITEPILAPIRALIQRSAIGRNMMLDFSPIIAFMLIGLIRYIIIGILF
jgi:YggT family protein